MKTRALCLTASVLALSWCSLAGAQTTASTTAPAAKDNTQTEVVVTAERRSTNLQTTPIAATVLTEADILRKGVFTVDQLQFVSPSITVNNFGQGNDVDIRGIGKGEHNSQTSTGVVTYRDSAATFPGYFQEEPFFDVAGIEVLRGPQGTFSGQNATGGAIIVNTADPKINGGYHGYLLGHYGNYNDGGLQGAVNIPIDDTLAARVAFYGQHRSSFFNISGPWTGDPNLNWGAARFSLLWQPSAKLKVLWKTDYDYLQNGGYFGDALTVGGNANPVSSNIFNFSNNHHTFATDQFVRTILKADYITDSGITLRSVSSYQQGRTAWKGDIDGVATPAPATDVFIEEAVDERLYSEEFNIISPDKGPFSWIVGAYYQNNRYLFPPGRFVIGLPYLGFNENLEGVNNTHSTAVFGQVTYKLTPTLEVQAGVRYSDWFTANNPVRFYIPQFLAFGYDFKSNQYFSGSNTTGKLSINWTPDARNFVYAFVASGAKPGGINTALYFGGGVTPPPFRQEYVTDYEAGWKTRLFDNHVKLQLGAFYNSFDHFQVIIPIPNQPTQATEQNVPNPTKLYGVEASAQATFGDFTGSFGMGLQKSKLGKFYSQDPRAAITAATCDLNNGPAVGSCKNYEGNSQTYAPNFTFNTAGQYNFHINGSDLLTPSVTYAHISSQWSSLYENAAAGDHLAARNIWGANLAWTHGDIVATLYGYNITDSKYIGANVSPIRIAGPPRQFGISVMKVF